ncbi:MAG: hypothetical protein AAFU57_18535, partial [Bacteroidota bacterium]
MSIFRKIREKFQSGTALDEIMDDMENLDEVLLKKRLEIFEEVVTPEFSKIGLSNWDGKYLWYNDFNQEGVKHVIEYNVFKYYGGSFSYGNCFHSVPTFSGKRLVNHRTDKSTKIHFFKRLDEWQKSYENNSHTNPDKISTINENKFRATLDAVLAHNLPRLTSWFENFTTLEQNIIGLENDVENPPYEIGQRIVSCEYILSFLYKQKGDLETAELWLQKHFEKQLNS